MNLVKELFAFFLQKQDPPRVLQPVLSICLVCSISNICTESSNGDY